MTEPRPGWMTHLSLEPDRWGFSMSKMKMILASRQAPMIGHLPAYANSISQLIPAIYAAMDVVSREMIGFATVVTRNTAAERVAVGQSITYPIAPPQVTTPIVPSMTPPTPPDNSFGVGTMAITRAEKVAFGFTGEEQKGLNSGGPGYLSAQAMLIAQAMRTIANAVESDISVEAALNASRAYGTAGTAPFGSGDLTDLAQLSKILDDNGAPQNRGAVLGSTAAAKLMALQNLTRVNEAGTQMTLRSGELLDIFGMSIHKTGQPYRHTKGTGAAATTNGAGYAVGATVITLASAGTGTIKKGDVVTFAGDTNKYVVAAGDTDVSNGGSITLAAPGLRVAIPAAATAITVGGNYEANVAFSQDAIQVAMRAPAAPTEGDLAHDRMIITDPRSGIPFEFSIWPGYRMVSGEVALAWGQKAVKSEHIATLLA